jgi:hypothetical protein
MRRPDPGWAYRAGPDLSHLGIYSNYAFADANITEFAPEGSPYPMAGVAKHKGDAGSVGDLTNEPLRLTQNNNDEDVRRCDVYGRTYLADLTFKF